MVSIKREGPGLPSRVIYYGLPGVGKTSTWTCAPKPIFMMMRGETGLLTLIDNGIVQPTDHFDDPVESVSQLKEYIKWLLDSKHDYKTLVIDALTGYESVINKHTCANHFDGDMSKFNAYQAGYKVAATEAEKINDLLDILRVKRRMGIAILAHSKIGTFKIVNDVPYNSYKVDCHDDMFAVMHKWADMILFAKRRITVATNKKEKTKVSTEGDLILHTDHSSTHVAKNRHNLPAEIYLGDNHVQAWNAFSQAIREGRKITEANNASIRQAAESQVQQSQNQPPTSIDSTEGN